MTLTEMINHYNALTAAHAYIVGFVLNHLLYYVRVDGNLPQEFLKLDRASSKRGGMAKVRVRLSSAIRTALVANGEAVLMGSETLLTDDRYNKGERFEKVITETLTAETWVKDSVPFNVAGDIELNGVQIQIKLDNAELTNEKILGRLLTA